ncbi:MAG: hypothetical protein AAGJ94_00150 [Pseudomonadota bacterium]
MSNFNDPTVQVKVNSGYIDTGDRAKTYVFDEDGPGSFRVIGTSDVKDVLNEIAATNDGKTQWGEDNNGDGEGRRDINLFDDNGNASDDFVALLREAFEGDQGITVVPDSIENGTITLAIAGQKSTDLLVFDGDYVNDAFAQVKNDLPIDVLKALAVEDPSGYAEMFGSSFVDMGDGRSKIGVYEFSEDVNDSFYWSHDKHLNEDVYSLFDRVNNQFQDEDAVALVKAALAEKCGIADYEGLEYRSDDGQAIVIDLTTKGGNIDTIVLHGSEIEAAIADFEDTFAGNHEGGNVFEVTALELAALNSIDGEAGCDTVKLIEGGTFDFTNVTLNSIEAITTDGANAELVLTSGAQAMLVQSADGDNDTAVLDYAPIVFEEILSLLTSGIETVTFGAGEGPFNTATLIDDGQTVKIVGDDSEFDVFGFTSRAEYVDVASGVVRQRTTELDDGSTRVINYDAEGVITDLTVTDDPDGNLPITSISELFTDGIIASREIIYDDGTRDVRTFDENGKLIQLVSHDGADGTAEDYFEYKTKTLEFDSEAGTRLKNTFIFDDDSDTVSVVRTLDQENPGHYTEVTTFVDGSTLTVEAGHSTGPLLKTLMFADGDQQIVGFDGEQIIQGGAGDDTMTGGEGNDTFVGLKDNGNDVITDFNAAGNDLLDLTLLGVDSLADLTDAGAIRQEGADVVIDFGDLSGDASGEIVLQNTNLASLSDDDFLI